MTLERIEISLEAAFAYGMFYVTFSRCTSIEGVRITGRLLPSQLYFIEAHPDVREFERTVRMVLKDESGFRNLSQRLQAAVDRDEL